MAKNSTCIRGPKYIQYMGKEESGAAREAGFFALVRNKNWHATFDRWRNIKGPMSKKYVIIPKTHKMSHKMSFMVIL